MRILKTKRSALLAVIGVLSLSAVAFAYWTANGTGSGNGTVGTDSGVTITAGLPETVYPGSDTNVDVRIQNPSNNTAVSVTGVVADTTQHVNGVEITKADGVTGTCDPAWFTYDGKSFGGRVELTPGQDWEAPTSADAFHMSNDSSANQDACKGASIKLHLKVTN